MANTYSQISMHIVFAVKHREALILKEFRHELFRYIYGIIEGKKQKSLAVNGFTDHVHIFAGLSPSIYIPDLVRDIKSDSSFYINTHKMSKRPFHWQEGYGIFSYSRSQRDRVIKYILNQEQHHQRKSFRKEYLGLLKNMDVQYDENYLFDFFD
ncbi:MAG: IS200/IS605 family transposase [Bacteroidales bacterium]|nr:IS200/IS605 family transposase [Bacteroidales bacterium]